MTIDLGALLAALRGEREVADVCLAAGITQAAFGAARDAELRRRLPPAAARLPAAVRGPVEILRDRAGVPHVYAGKTPDLYFGLGFATAQDRLWQIDRLRRRALGRLAEVLGSGFVRSDLIHRTVGIGRIADAEVARLDDRTHAIVDAYVQGINRQVEIGAGQLPIEFSLLGYTPEPFTVADVLAILRGMWWSLNGRLEQLVVTEAARLLPDDALRALYLTPEAPETRIVPPDASYPPDDLVVPPPQEVLAGMSDATGSNNWAVSGRRTASGGAILCSDPHQQFWLPSSWYEYALHGPEDDAAGAGHPGVPGLWWGCNGVIAWGLTNNGASTRDLYVETIDAQDAPLDSARDSDDWGNLGGAVEGGQKAQAEAQTEAQDAPPGRYRDGAGWRSFDTRTEEILVRGAAPQRFTVRATVRGPVMNDVLPALGAGASSAGASSAGAGGAGRDPPLSLRWVGQEHLDDVRALVAIGRARDWPSFRDALRDWSVPVFNFGYADRTGRVGYQCAGRIPIRGRVRRGFREAAQPQDAWQGYIPFDALPHQDDPPRGYIASANNRVAPDDYPYPLYGAWAAGHRAARLAQALEQPAMNTGDTGDTGGALGNGRVDREVMVALQNDVKSTRAERLCPPLLRRLRSLCGTDTDEHGDMYLLCQVLGAWDYGYALESSAPVVFETFMGRWGERVAAERFPSHLVPLLKGQGEATARLLEGDDPSWFPGGAAALGRALLETAGEAVAEVRHRWGADVAGWRWGRVHQAHWRHLLSNEATAAAFDLGPVPVDGGADTVRNTGLSPAFGADSGAEYRLVVDFAAPDRFWAVQNAGNSGQPGSPHYADQLAPWIAGEYHVVHLRRPGVEGDLASTTVLEPASA